MKHSSPIEAGQTNHNREQRIDAINQVFALFRLNYHAQFFKAFATETELVQIKKLWLNELTRFEPDALLMAAKTIIESSDYLPTMHTMIKHCESASNMSMPDAHTAYLEACRAPSPKAQYAWSHPAIYHAGKECDWYFLQTSSESSAYPIFRKKYRDICERISRGEVYEVNPPNDKPGINETPLSKAENHQKMQSMMQALDL